MNEKRHIARHTLAVLTVLLCWGCASDDARTDVQPTEPQGDVPLTLGVAEVVEAQTRSGAPGSIDYSVLSKSTYGFGVVADSPLNWVNQKVTYVDDAGTTNPSTTFVYPSRWRYADAVKYWKSDLNGGPIDFYAYAPYVATPSGSDGITSINGTEVSYTINTTIGEGVDLLWGVNGTTGKPWTNTTYTDATGTNTPTGGPVMFTFRHALAAIGFRVQAMIGKDNNTSDFEDYSAVEGVLRDSGNYKITVKKIELKGKFYPSGTLSLNNTERNKPLWSNTTLPSDEQTLTVESRVENSQIVPAIKHLHANETTTSAEAKTIMEDPNNGVSQEVQQQVVVNDGNGQEKCFLVIPNETAQNYTVTLHWCVSTKLPDDTYRSEDHTSTLTISSWTLQAGTKYLLTFVIGLKMIGLEVTATDWTETNENVDVKIEHGTSASESLARAARR